MSVWGWPATRERQVALANLAAFLVFFSAAGLVGMIWGEAAASAGYVCLIIAAVIAFPVGWIGLAILPLGPIALIATPVFLVWNSRLWGRVIVGSRQRADKQRSETTPESQRISEARPDT